MNLRAAQRRGLVPRIEPHRIAMQRRANRKFRLIQKAITVVLSTNTASARLLLSSLTPAVQKESPE